MTPTACPEIGKVLLPGQIGSSVFGTCCAGNACWMGLTLMINSGIQRTGVWLSDIDCNTCPSVLYFSHRLTPSRSLLLWRQKKALFFPVERNKSQDFCTNLHCRLHAFWFETQVGCNKNFSRRHLHRCRALAELWVVIGFNLQMTTALTKASTWTTMAGSLWGGSSLQSFGRDTLRGFTHHLVLVTEKSSDDQHIFVDTYLDFIRFFESDASSNPACLFIYIYTYTCCICKCKRIYTYTNIYTLL